MKRKKKKIVIGSAKDKWRQSIISDTRELYEDIMGDRVNHKAACLYWSTILVMVAMMRGRKSLILQGGSASFQRVPDEMDDGVIHTHFSYVFEEDSLSNIHAIAAGVMPEMHCWVADTATGELIDLTTGFQPSQCVETTGMEWFSPDPPPYVWGTHDDIQRAMPGTFYDAQKFPTMIAHKYGQIFIENENVLGKIRSFYSKRRGS